MDDWFGDKYKFYMKEKCVGFKNKWFLGQELTIFFSAKAR